MHTDPTPPESGSSKRANAIETSGKTTKASTTEAAEKVKENEKKKPAPADSLKKSPLSVENTINTQKKQVPASAGPIIAPQKSTVPADGQKSTVPADGQKSTIPADNQKSTLPADDQKKKKSLKSIAEKSSNTKKKPSAEVINKKAEEEEPLLAQTPASESTAEVTAVTPRRRCQTPRTAQTPKRAQTPRTAQTPKKSQKNNNLVATTPPVVYVEDSHAEVFQCSRELTSREVIKPPGKTKNGQSTGGGISMEKFGIWDKVQKNFATIQSEKRPTLMRRLRKWKYFPILDTCLTGFTILFFALAWYLHFHINPTLESKMRPEFRAKVMPMFHGDKNFAGCPHSSFVEDNNKTIAPIIDDARCFDEYEHGRVFFEIYKSSQPNATNGCNIDRVEVHPCYIKNDTHDPLNIIWETNAQFIDYGCNGTNDDLFSFTPPVRKSVLITPQVQETLVGRNIVSSAFYYQCPKCTISSRNVSGSPDYCSYGITQLAAAIPHGIRQCAPSWEFPCDINQNILIRNVPETFSQAVLPFKIVQDDL